MRRTFSIPLAERGGACRPGLDQARSLLKRQRSYSVSQLVKAGLSVENILWLVMEEAKTDPEAAAKLRQWVRLCGGQVSSLATPEECVSVASRAFVDEVTELRKGGMPRQMAKDQARAKQAERLVQVFAVDKPKSRTVRR